MTEPNWLVTLVLAAVLSIPISIGANLLTPRIKDWLDRRNLTNRSKALQRSKIEYDRLKQFHDDPARLQVKAYRTFLSLIADFLFILASIGVVAAFSDAGLRVIMLMVLATLVGLGFVIGIDLDNDLEKLSSFEKTETKLLARIKELETEVAQKK